jgi:hypothetical protein
LPSAGLGKLLSEVAQPVFHGYQRRFDPDDFPLQFTAQQIVCDLLGRLLQPDGRALELIHGNPDAADGWNIQLMKRSDARSNRRGIHARLLVAVLVGGPVVAPRKGNDIVHWVCEPYPFE